MIAAHDLPAITARSPAGAGEGAGGLDLRPPAFLDQIIAEIRRIAAAYPPEAAATAADDRRRFMTPLQQLGWFARFRPNDPEAEVLSAIVAGEGPVNPAIAIHPATYPHQEAHHG